MWILLTLFFILLFIYLFLERGERSEKDRKRNINVWLPLAHNPDMYSRLGIEPATLWFAGWHSIH